MLIGPLTPGTWECRFPCRSISDEFLGKEEGRYLLELTAGNAVVHFPIQILIIIPSYVILVHIPTREVCNIFSAISVGCSFIDHIAVTEYYLSLRSQMNYFMLYTLVVFILLISSGSILQIRGLVAIDGTERDASKWCESWRLMVETHNARDWKSVPAECVEYVGHYMKGGQYEKDFQFVVNLARAYLHSSQVQVVGDGKDAWIFDVDETALSNLGFYEQNDFGGTPFNHSKYFAWVMEEKATALKATLSLYNELKAMGFSIFFITGRRSMYRNVTANNLLHEGYKNWSGLLMRELDDKPGNVWSLKITKRAELEKQGYQLWGNMGDQWSDLLGGPEGFRSFKLPNPMYYVG